MWISTGTYIENVDEYVEGGDGADAGARLSAFPGMSRAFYSWKLTYISTPARCSRAIICQKI